MLNELKHAQRSIIIEVNGFNATVIRNLDFTNTGMEVEVVAIFTDTLESSVSWGLLDLDTETSIARPYFTPNATFNIALDYERERASGTLKANVNYAWSDEFAVTVFNVPADPNNADILEATTVDSAVFYIHMMTQLVGQGAGP